MALRTLKVDFMKHENACNHHTADYDNPHLILRRGQKFTFKVSFNRAVTHRDHIILQFTTSHRPSKANGSLVQVDVTPTEENKDWSATMGENHGNEYTITVKSPANAILGKYQLSVISGRGAVFTAAGSHIYILCNPWCEDDSVFMLDEEERWEYVLNDTGYIYVGTSSKINARPWNFGQHEKDVLDCCMYLLDMSDLKVSAKRDPVILARKFSALVNSSDDNGVLAGNWSGNYSAGISPTAWTGSSAILQQYYQTKRPVRFGQCWVFSGVLTAVMRCLGIPARSVTNFNSAHDTEENLKIDYYQNEQGETVDDISSDSVWNFHVWNDVWMKRPDLPAGYDGWQAIDATPQEKSQGIFQCGPCSLKAIKEGVVYLPYDGKFLFAEVNADKIQWLVTWADGEEEFTKVKEEQKSIGKNISTKAVKKNFKEDITMQYKHREGSEEERESFGTACSHLKSDVCMVYAAPPPPPAGLKLQITGDNELPPGNNLCLNIVLENELDETKSVTVTAGCQLQTYTGKIIASLASINQTVEVAGKQAGTVPFNVAADLYMKSVTLVDDELMIRVNVLVETKDTQEKISEFLMIPFVCPPLKVEMPETVKINEDFTCTFTFKNTLSIPLEKCEMHVEGLGLFKLEKFEHGDIRPGGLFRTKIICAPKKTGERKIVVELISKQMKGISVERMINIIE